MPNFNKVMLMGNLTRDPELRYTPSGTAVAKFGLAVNRRYRPQGGDQVEETCFVDITAFGRQAEVVSQYLSKGRPIFLEGRLNFSRWESQDGQKRSKLDVVLENFQFIGGRGDDQDAGQQGQGRGQAPPPERQQRQRPQQQAPPPQHDDLADDDIPF